MLEAIVIQNEPQKLEEHQARTLLAFLSRAGGGVGGEGGVYVCFQGSEYDGNREETSALGPWRPSTSRAQEYLAVAMTNKLPIFF